MSGNNLQKKRDFKSNPETSMQLPLDAFPDQNVNSFRVERATDNLSTKNLNGSVDNVMESLENVPGASSLGNLGEDDAKTKPEKVPFSFNDQHTSSEESPKLLVNQDSTRAFIGEDSVSDYQDLKFEK